MSAIPRITAISAVWCYSANFLVSRLGRLYATALSTRTIRDSIPRHTIRATPCKRNRR